MKKYNISEKANKLISENELLYYFNDNDVVSMILYSKDKPETEILIRNWTEPDTLKFEGYYGSSAKKTKKNHNWWKSHHKFFISCKDDFWGEYGEWNNERYYNII